MANGAGAEWTISALHEHLRVVIDERDKLCQQRFTDLEKAMFMALATSEKAIDKAESANERRFESVNEFRNTLSDQAAAFLTRKESEAATGRNTERIVELTAQIQLLATRSETVSAYTNATNRITALENRVNIAEGKGTGLNAAYVYLIAAIGVIGTMVTIYFTLKK